MRATRPPSAVVRHGALLAIGRLLVLWLALVAIPLMATDSLQVSAATSQTAGGSFTVTVTAITGMATDTGYTGTVHFTSTDGTAILPADATLTSGVGTFSVTLKTAGTQSVTATDTGNGSITGTQSNVIVGPAATTVLSVSGFADPTAGIAGNVTVTAKDTFGNTTPAYGGTVHVTSSDGLAVLPADNTLSAGTRSFSVTLKTAGTQTITATDGSITGTQSNITVTAAAAASFTVSGFTDPTVAGVAHNVTVTALDTFGNTATGYTGTVHFTSSDAQGVLPANSTLTLGTGIFSVTMKTVGEQTIVATDTVSSSITGTQANVTVDPAATASLTVLGFSDPVTAGVADNVTVTAKDAFGNTTPAYGGTVHFTSSDGAAVLAANSTLTSGTGTFSVTLKTSGTRNITATDAVTLTITGAQSNINVTAAAAALFTVAGFTDPTTAGVAHNVTVTAKDSFGNTDTGYSGTVHLTSSDAAATLPADATLTAGTRTFSVTLKTAGSQSITATDTVTTSITGTQSAIDVDPAAASKLAISAIPAAATAAVLFSPQPVIQIQDAFGNLVDDDTTTVTAGLTTGNSGQFKGTKTVTAANGIATFTNLRHDQTQTIVIRFTSSPSLTSVSTVSIVVSAGTATSFSLTGFPSPQTAGTAGTIVVTALDAAGNTATGYTGFAHFTSTDGSATLPSNYHFTVGDAGVHTFTNGVTLKTAGTQSITATDTVTASITGSQTSITVDPDVVNNLLVSGFSSPHVAGVAGSVTVRARDIYNNTVTGYLGTVTFSTSDVQAVLPPNYTFQVSDNGVATFASGVMFKTTGTWAITATDTVTGTLTGSQSGISITSAPASTLVLTGLPATQVAGNTGTLTVTARDPYGNTATTYLGTVHFTSSDGAATLPANATFTGGNAGVRTFVNGVTLKTVGSQSVTATDTVTATITGSQSGIVVTPGPTISLAVSGFPASQVAGTVGSVTVTARDAQGNTATDYTGTVHFTSTDAQAVLPTNYTFVAGDNGVHTFSGGVTLKTAGSRSITATDTVTGSITGTQSGITITPTTAIALVFTQQPGSATVGSAFGQQPRLRSEDTYGNASTIGLGATVPLSISLVSGSGILQGITSRNIGTVAPDTAAGIAFFTNLRLDESSDAKVLRASVTLNGSLVEVDSSSFNVTPGAAHHLRVVGSSSATAGVGTIVTLRAEDSFNNLATAFTQSLAVDIAGLLNGTNGEVSSITDQAGTARPVVGATTATLVFANGLAGTAQDPDQGVLVPMRAGLASITATGGSLVAGTALDMTVAAGAAQKLTITAVSNATPTAGQAITADVALQDAGGNTVPTITQIDLLLSTSPTAGSLRAGATGTSITAGNGTTTVAGLFLDHAENSVVLTIADVASVLTAGTTALTVNNDQPVLSIASGQLTYAGGSGAIPFGTPGIAVSDINSEGFAPFFTGATITASIAAGGVSTEDLLQVRSAGTINVSGSAVSWNATPIATVSGGFAGASLVVTITGTDVPKAAVTALLENLCFRNFAGANPTLGVRTVNLAFKDGSTSAPGGERSAVAVTRVINVVVGNALPVITANVELSVVRSSTTLITSSNLAVSDDESDVDALTFTVVDFPTEGDLVLGSGVGAVTLSAGGTESFTQAQINANVLSYHHKGSSLPGDVFTFIVSDGLNQLPVTTFSITVPGADANPVLFLPLETLLYNENAAPSVLVPGAPLTSGTLVSDANTFEFSNGLLLVEIVDKDGNPDFHPDDRLTVRSQTLPGFAQYNPSDTSTYYVPEMDYTGHIAMVGTDVVRRQYSFYHYWANNYFNSYYPGQYPDPGGLPFPSPAPLSPSPSPPPPYTNYPNSWYFGYPVPLDLRMATRDDTLIGVGGKLRFTLLSGDGAVSGDHIVSAQAVAHLIDNLSFANLSDNPPERDRWLRITLSESAPSTAVGVASLLLKINTTNDPPVFEVPAPLPAPVETFEALAGVPLRVRVLANDPDLPSTSSLIYSLTSITPPSAGVAIVNATSGALEFTPLPSFVGPVTLVARATDNLGAWVEANVEVVVLAGPTDLGPLVVSDPPFEGFVGEALSYAMVIRPDPGLPAPALGMVSVTMVGDVPVGALLIPGADQLHPLLEVTSLVRPPDGVYTFGIRVEINYAGTIRIGYQPVTFKVRASGAPN